jgi:hypothetical protein
MDRFTEESVFDLARNFRLSHKEDGRETEQQWEKAA